jgi:hypothetical protein
MYSLALLARTKAMIPPIKLNRRAMPPKIYAMVVEGGLHQILVPFESSKRNKLI